MFSTLELPSQTTKKYYRIYPYRIPGVHFLQTIINQVYMSPFCLFYIGVYFYSDKYGNYISNTGQALVVCMI